MQPDPIHAHHIPGLLKEILTYVYNTDQLLGSGSFSVVYKGINVRTNTPVAIKVIDRQSITNQIDDMLLNNEVECHKIISHESIIKTLDLCKTVNNIYIICQYCQSGDLFSYVQKRGKLSQDEVLLIITQLIKAVHHIHSKGILHRDIKTANILLRNGNQVKLADFGFAEFVGLDFAKGQYSVGSPIYMSPEAFVDSEYSVKSDSWSIGIVLYEMLLGKQPFNGISFQLFMYLFRSGEVYTPIMNASPFMLNFLQKILDLDPRTRIDTVGMLQMLSQRSILGQLPPQMPTVPQGGVPPMQLPIQPPIQPLNQSYGQPIPQAYNYGQMAQPFNLLPQQPFVPVSHNFRTDIPIGYRRNDGPRPIIANRAAIMAMPLY